MYFSQFVYHNAAVNICCYIQSSPHPGNLFHLFTHIDNEVNATLHEMSQSNLTDNSNIDSARSDDTFVKVIDKHLEQPVTLMLQNLLIIYNYHTTFLLCKT